nr:hypothetical protein CFP56_04355 [Quercus suber]
MLFATSSSRQARWAAREQLLRPRGSWDGDRHTLCMQQRWAKPLRSRGIAGFDVRAWTRPRGPSRGMPVDLEPARRFSPTCWTAPGTKHVAPPPHRAKAVQCHRVTAAGPSTMASAMVGASNALLLVDAPKDRAVCACSRLYPASMSS